MTDLLSHFTGQKQAMLDQLVELVNFETPTTDKAAVDKLGAHMETLFKALGASSVTTIPQTEVGDFKLAKWNEDAPGKPLMFLIHIDTVWPLGTLAERPIRYDDEGRIFGPGAIDMKGGITVVLSAIKGLRDLGQFPNRPVWVLMTSDEEVGSVHSIPVIRQTAPGCWSCMTATRTRLVAPAASRMAWRRRTAYGPVSPSAAITGCTPSARHRVRPAARPRSSSSAAIRSAKPGSSRS